MLYLMIYLGIGFVFMWVRFIVGIKYLGAEFYDSWKIIWIIEFICENVLFWPVDLIISIVFAIGNKHGNERIMEITLDGMEAVLKEDEDFEEVYKLNKIRVE